MRETMGIFTILGAAAIVFLSSAHVSNAATADFFQPSASSPTPNTEVEFNWKELVPSTDLTWVSCYTDYECTRLKVPLNYSEPGVESAAIAMMRIKSPLLISGADDYRGPILFNPGGPGGSGVDFLLRTGKSLATIVGPQFDVVSFDPRGVGRSTPAVSFFETPAERALWSGNELTNVASSPVALAYNWARYQIYGRLAEERDKAKDVLIHINTENTARDMLQITQAHGRDKLQYWGFSYGTILGATFASILPNHVERMIIDGVADAENYFATLWSNNLLDTDKTMQSFFDSCIEAGSERCPFYAPSAQSISDRLDILYDSIRAHPVPVYSDSGYGVVDYTMLRASIFQALYKPYAVFPRLAQALADLEGGNGTEILKLTNSDKRFECQCDSSNGSFEIISDASAAIACTDGKEVRDSVQDFEIFYNEMRNISEWADVWTRLRMRCSGWPKQQKSHFQGPFIGNTSFPILVIGNTADPVTPLWAANKMSKGFSGSVVLTQDSPGHCSLAAPSICTQRHIREYFVNGTMPKAGTICSVDEPIFPSVSTEPQSESQIRFQAELDGEDKEMYEAIREMSRSDNLLYPL